MGPPSQHWLPVRATWHNEQLWLAWLHFGSRPLRGPFFENDVRACLQEPFNQLFARGTPIDSLAERIDRHPGLAPSGLIFHMSRCGSTLVSSMLAAVPGTLVMSEASPIDTIVQLWRLRPDLGTHLVTWLQWIVAALGCPRFGERRYVLKLDSWHALALPLFRKAFPAVPWVFLYRDPVEVLVSHGTMAAPQMIPGAMRALASYVVAQTDDPADYCGCVLAAICEAALADHDAARADVINYADLPDAVRTIVCPRFGLDDAAFMQSPAHDLTHRDAKAPDRAFVADADAKQRMASPAIHRIAEHRLRDVYARLEEIRRGGRADVT